jgi:hypothetical protein
MTRLYATLAQVRDYTGNQGLVVSPRNLALASQLVEAAAGGAIYETDDAGMPTDPDTLAAFTAATCELVALAHPDEPSGAMSDDVAAMRRNGVESATVNGVTIKLGAPVQVGGFDVGWAVEVPASVRRILDQAGLSRGQVVVVFG